MRTRTLLLLAIAIGFSLTFSVNLAFAQSSTPTPSFYPDWNWTSESVSFETEEYILEYSADGAGTFHGLRCDDYDSQNPDHCSGPLTHVHWHGTESTTSVIDPNPTVVRDGSLRLDEQGQLHLILSGQTITDSLRYLTWDKSEWHSQTLPVAGIFESLLLDAASSPHIFYQQAGSLEHAYLVESEWVTDTVDISCPDEFVADEREITLDVLNQIHIVQNCNSTIKNAVDMIVYYQPTDDDWESTVVDTTNGDEAELTNASLSVDVAGRIYIAYGTVQPDPGGWCNGNWFVVEIIEGSEGERQRELMATDTYFSCSHSLHMHRIIASGQTLHFLYETGPFSAGSASIIPLTYLGYNPRGRVIKRINATTSTMAGYSWVDSPKIALSNAGMPYVSWVKMGYGPNFPTDPYIETAIASPQFILDTFLPMVSQGD